MTAYTILYSHNGGATWSTVESPANTVSDIQWWLSNSLPGGASGSVSFKVSVPGTYTGTLVPNTGGLSFGYVSPFVEDDAVTLIRGSNSLGDSVFRDDGANSLFANGSQDTGETGIANVTLRLYYDLDGDGVLDPGDVLWGTTATNGSVANNSDPTSGGVTSGAVTLSVGGEPTGEAGEDGSYPDGNSNLTADFGFFELLTLGNTVWLDLDNDGLIDPGEPGASGVVLNLLDGAGNAVLHPVTGRPITATTNASGFFQFADLYPGNYIVQVAPANFLPGGPLAGYISSAGSIDPDDDTDRDDNGNDTPDPATTGILSDPVTLTYNTEPAGGDDGDDNDNTNLSVDFGFVIDPTAVELLYFRVADISGRKVTLGWATAAEIDNFGFNLYRGTSNDFSRAEWQHFVPSALKGSGRGAMYGYVNTVPHQGVWWYWLVDIDTQGRETVHSPISAYVGVDAGLPFRHYLPIVTMRQP